MIFQIESKIDDFWKGEVQESFSWNKPTLISSLELEAARALGSRKYDVYGIIKEATPQGYSDPEGEDIGIMIVFPDYLVDTESFAGHQRLGHAGVLLIDKETGLTKYYEYGRYPTTDGTKGRVRKVTISDVVIDKKTGQPTQKSLNKVLSQISKRAGKGGRIEGAYVEGDFDIMNDYAQKKLKESNPQYKEYDKDRDPYTVTGNNCGTFSDDVLKQDSGVKKKAPWIFIPTPDNIAEEYQDNFPDIDYDPKTNTTTGEIYEEK